MKRKITTTSRTKKITKTEERAEKKTIQKKMNEEKIF